jgi:CBS domain-containing protein
MDPAVSLGDAQVAADLMLADPKTLPADATVAEVREQLANPKVQAVLLADGPKFRGAVTAIPAQAAGTEVALAYAEADPDVISPDAPAATAFERAHANPHRRVIVLDDQHNLVGLLCLNARRTGFCQTPSS